MGKRILKLSSMNARFVKCLLLAIQQSKIAKVIEKSYEHTKRLVERAKG